ncbi:hypothetical protein WN51_05720 [Melipona quadrifasciata]|uniref:Uncharacterized protein n=1 Tax=Melipona quadrifasciata TaxID=166423 RepID=A0A0N0BIK4_9HYME|nr:hypothetical protein WN51_05720 [Melipona quadrifasciata]
MWYLHEVGIAETISHLVRWDPSGRAALQPSAIRNASPPLQYGQIEATTNHSGSLRMAHEPGVLQEDAGRVEMVTSMKGTTSLR